ncbi:histidine kinase dimerization/phosphoacceptor domain -containing protein [Paracoccaceae bacterium Fryx2]|nr:histidine kinase dimerization/phosphoacceptor domain -containing protein [Paracoccaceae bacterium Fryx2]
MVAVGVALTPLAVVAYFQASAVEGEAQARARAALFGETLRAAAPRVEAITRTRGLASALAMRLPDVLGDPVRCGDAMRQLLAAEKNLSFAGFIDTEGRMTCTSNGGSADFSESPRFKALLADPKETMTVNPRGPMSGVSVLLVTNPVRDPAGGLLGFLSLSMPHQEMQPIAGGGRGIDHLPLDLVTFNGEGVPLTTTLDLATVETRLPVGRPLASLTGGVPLIFNGTIGSGADRLFAVVPIVPEVLYVLSSWAPITSQTMTFDGLVPLWAFPAAMWLASLLVAWLAAERQTMRHIRALRRSITAFADGNRMVKPPSMLHAPNELRDVGDAYERLVESVLHDEARLEDTIHQKEVLLREVHHRVKNNLQLIASIMNIQMRKAFSPEAKLLVKGLHDRVMSLATVHRELYQTSGLTDVSADELLSTIVAQVLRMGSAPDRQIETSASFDPIRLTPDQAVPLSLILTEALTNVLKHAGKDADGRIRLSVTLRSGGEGRAILRVSNSLRDLPSNATPVPDMDSTNLGEQLLAAFATQLGGDLSFTRADGQFIVTLDFPLRSLTEGEDRFTDG